MTHLTERNIIRRNALDIIECNRFTEKVLKDFLYRLFETSEDFDSIFEDLNREWVGFANRKNRLMLSEARKKSPKWVTEVDANWFYNWAKNRDLSGAEEYNLN